MINVPEIFGSMVFNETAMVERLPKNIYKELMQIMRQGKSLDISISDTVATAMKEWAMEKGATHFTHWFHPMGGLTAEKHDGFITAGENGRVLMEFSGKELIKGESDASSFPSGGLRATFEARGYTAWDPTSYAFVKDNTLYIPSVFCSYSGEVLDKKTPLLKSMDLLNIHALRILRLFGNHSVKRVTPTVGAEQEYFLVDKSVYEQRKDLIFCGKTLFGARPLKGQELDGHYFGVIKKRVADYLSELDVELWKLGILAKIEHNEVAPSQYEIAPIFTTSNIATDQNQLIMQVMQSVAKRHGFVCLFNERPFRYINGSGKHNNWSLSTDTGLNLLEPTDCPYGNVQFLLFVCAILKGVDQYQELLRASVASAGNDHRLGSNEAPPAIMSVFLGSELTDILTALAEQSVYTTPEQIDLEIGVDTLPKFIKDSTDRNRTSPFAFTGNKFEFRMVGANLSLAEPNIMLNIIVADQLCQFADVLEDSTDFKQAVNDILVNSVKSHKRIIFNGNNYSPLWLEEARSRGLLNLPSTVEALPHLISDKNLDLFVRYNLYTPAEIKSRYHVLMERYCKTIDMEARVLTDMAIRQILPAALAYTSDLVTLVNGKLSVDRSLSYSAESALINQLSTLCDKLYDHSGKIRLLLNDIPRLFDVSSIVETARLYRKKIIPAMEDLRLILDELEGLVSQNHWPIPTYSELLFSI